MMTGFARFDQASRDNLLASMLALTMGVDGAVKELVVRLVRTALGFDQSARLLSFGCEARLNATEDDNYARVDLWFLFGPLPSAFYAFVEVKTHDGWSTEHVVEQVMDQAERALARRPHPIRGSVLLGPARLCRKVAAVDACVPILTWPTLLSKLRALGRSSDLLPFTIRHLEDASDKPVGIDREFALEQLEIATTTMACLGKFIVDCIHDLNGHVQCDPLYLTPVDGAPRRGSGWAWHWLSVPLTLGKKRGRLNVYKHEEAPVGEEATLSEMWLEAYLGDARAAVVTMPFLPTKRTETKFGKCRGSFGTAWSSAKL